MRNPLRDGATRSTSFPLGPPGMWSGGRSGPSPTACIQCRLSVRKSFSLGVGTDLGYFLDGSCPRGDRDRGGHPAAEAAPGGMRMPLSAPRIPTLDANGATVPRLGLGTWQLRGEVCERTVAAALRLGYTHVDTAQGYGNEEAVGAGIAASGVPRERLFLTTKVRPDRMGDGDLQRSVEESLLKLAGHAGRSPAAALAQPGDPARRQHPRPERGQARRSRPAHRPVQLHQRAARGSLAADRGAVRGRADRVPSVSRPDADAWRPALARHGADRLLPDRARQGRRRSGDRGDRRGARPQRRAGHAALAGAAGRHRRHPAHVAGRAAVREPRRLRLRARRGGDGAHERARPGRARAS